MRFSVKKTVMWGGMGALVLIGTLIVLPLFLNHEYLQGLALKQLQQTFGPHVRVGLTSLALFPQPHFVVSDIVVKEQPESHAVFRAQSMSLKLEVGQLIRRNIVVREFILDHPEIELYRDTAGEWRFLGHSTHESPLSSLAAFLVRGKFVVTEGKVIVIDESPTDAVRGVILEDVAFVSETSHEDVSVVSTLALSGKLRQAHEVVQFGINGKFDIELRGPLSSLEPSSLAFEQVRFSGHVVVDNVAFQQLAEYLPNGESFLQLPGTLNVASQVEWVSHGRGSQLHLSNIALASGAFTLAGSANVEELEDGNRVMTLSIRSPSLDLDLIRRVMPRVWIPNDLVAVWIKGEWGGELEIVEARITGSTREDVGTSVAGTFRIHNGFFSFPGWPRTENIRGTVVVDPDRVQLSDVHGTYDGIPVDVTQGVVLFNDSGPLADVEIQAPVPAEKVWNFVHHLGGSHSDFKVLNSWKVSQGSGRLRLRFAGNIFDVQGLTFQNGDYQPQDVVLRIPGLPHDLSDTRGKFIFSPDSTVLEGIQGSIGIFPFAISGTLVHQRKPRFEPLNITAGFAGKDLLERSDQTQNESGVQIEGPLKVSLTLKGPVSHPKITGTVEGESAMIQIPSILKKDAGQAGILEFDGQFHSGGTVQFERVELVMLPLHFRGQGGIRFRPVWAWEGRLDSGPIYVGLLPEGIRVLGDVIQSGILEIQLRGSGHGMDWTRWNAKGWVALTEGVMTLPGIQDPLSNLFVRLKVDKDVLDLKRMEFRMKKSEAVITGFMKNWKNAPQVSVHLKAPRFDIDLLIPKAKQSVLRDGIEWLAHHGTLEGSVFVDRPTYKTFSGRKLSAKLKIHDNLVSIDNVQAMIEETGSVSGRFFIHLPPGKSAAMRASFQAKNLPFDKMLKVLGDERRVVTGDMNIRGMIQGHGRDRRGIIPTLNGGMEFSLRQGNIRQGSILPKILRLLNLPHVLRGKVNFNQEGFPFEHVSSTLTIKEGNFSTKNFYLHSPIMKTAAVGIYNLERDQLDGVIAVSPFGAYFDALKKIPLFGNIFPSDGTGMATAMFNVAGPLVDPDIVYMPEESFKAGFTGQAQLAFEVLKNTVRMPVEFLSSSKEDSNSLPSK